MMYFEVEGCGPDKFVLAQDYESAARAVAEHEAAGALDRFEWLDSGGLGRLAAARYEWAAGTSTVGSAPRVRLLSDVTTTSEVSIGHGPGVVNGFYTSRHRKKALTRKGRAGRVGGS
jgi:hypothetical protein